MLYGILTVLFLLSGFALVYTYFLYPRFVIWYAKNKKGNTQFFDEDSLPYVSVLMSVYNEESVIDQKIQSLLQQDYPKHKLSIFIGSDCSADQSDEIVQKYADANPNLFFFPFYERQGKPGVINQLATKAFAKTSDENHIFLITDANVILSPVVLKKLSRHFKNPAIAIVDANMVHTGMQVEGISLSEDYYISSEVTLKHSESLIWGKMAGPFGGCYALRASYFCEVPANFLVDDFYIAMKVFEKGGDVINDLEAVCYEAVSHEMMEEFRRKARISAGNFQNLVTFPHLWWPPFRLPAFVLFSHKVLRWLGPLFILIMMVISLLFTIWGVLYYQLFFAALCFGVFILPLLDKSLNKLGLNLFLLRSIRYFMLMNIALAKGFFKFLKGIKHNAWEPPKRN